MRIEINWISKRSGMEVKAYYEESADFSKLPQEKIKSVCAFCYTEGKFVLVKNEGRWEPVAGHVEKDETAEQALIREVQEESNMKVLKFFPLGYLYTYGVDFYQTRYLCLVEPYGPFVADPDGGVTEIRLVDIDELNKYFTWGPVDDLLKKQIDEKLKNL